MYRNMNANDRLKIINLQSSFEKPKRSVTIKINFINKNFIFNNLKSQLTLQ